MSSVVGAIFFQKLLIPVDGSGKREDFDYPQPLSKYTTVFLLFRSYSKKNVRLCSVSIICFLNSIRTLLIKVDFRIGVFCYMKGKMILSPILQFVFFLKKEIGINNSFRQQIKSKFHKKVTTLI
jgi:hypothetical protein